MISRRVAAHYTAAKKGTEVAPTRFGSMTDLVSEDEAYRLASSSRKIVTTGVMS